MTKEERKQLALQEWLQAPIAQNDTFYIKDNPETWLALGARGSKMICSTKKNEDLRQFIEINNPKIYKKESDFQGLNPLKENNIRFTNFSIEGIFSYMGIGRSSKEILKPGEVEMPYWNWNPYFIINGKQVHYQRGYVWSLEQKQALIESIYKNLECGRVIVHHHSWQQQEKMVKAGYVDFAARDIVDGKQRLSTILAFVNDEFCDNKGFYYSDFSTIAQRRFMNYTGLLYGEMDEYCSPEQICDAFLNNAVSGTPISKEHIEFMEKTKQELLNPKQ